MVVAFVAAEHLVPDELEELRERKLAATAAARQQVDAHLLTVICTHARTHTHLITPTQFCTARRRGA